MEISDFLANEVTQTYTEHGKSLEITVNADAFTPNFLRDAAKMMRKLGGLSEETKKLAEGIEAESAEAIAIGMEATASSLDAQKEVYSELLSTHVIKGWNVTRNGEPFPPTAENLRTLQPRTVIGLWNWAFNIASPKEHETLPTGTSLTTQETTSAGSLRVENSVEDRPM